MDNSNDAGTRILSPDMTNFYIIIMRIRNGLNDRLKRTTESKFSKLITHDGAVEFINNFSFSFEVNTKKNFLRNIYFFHITSNETNFMCNAIIQECIFLSFRLSF